MNLVANVGTLSPQRSILGLPVCEMGWTGALSFVNELACLPVGQTVVSFLNANNANLMVRDPEYRAVLERQLVLPDGIGLDLASRVLHGTRFPANLNGTDFVPALLSYMEGKKRIGVIGTRPGVLDTAVHQFSRHAPWHEFIAISDGYFDRAKSRDVVAEIEKLDLDILIVGMGSPGQEKWVDRYIQPQHARLVITVGALLDFVAGEVPRAPMVIRQLRMEWLYRLMLEPTRLWRRYIIGIPVFFFHILRYRLASPKEHVNSADTAANI